MEIQKTMYMNQLYDFYGELLTAKQKEYLELYYEQDLSLSEISQELNVSRQAVYDNIKRTEVILNEYELQLQLVAQFKWRQQKINDMERYIMTRYPDDHDLYDFIIELRNGE